MSNPANEKAPRPRWTYEKGVVSAVTYLLEGTRIAGTIIVRQDAEEICAALNAQAPPPAEPPTLTRDELDWLKSVAQADSTPEGRLAVAILHRLAAAPPSDAPAPPAKETPDGEKG
jgi:hypothetical protein